MTASYLSHTSADPNPLAGITRCIRRICMLREQDNAAEASRVEQTEFANAIRDLRLAHGPEVLPESELRSMFAAEEKRVADAIVLSELLIPQLVKSFPPASSTVAQSRPLATVASVQEASATPFPRAAAAAGVSPIIADMLDAMLASERTGRRPLVGAKS